MSNAQHTNILDANTSKQESLFLDFCKLPFYTFPRILHDIECNYMRLNYRINDW